MMRFLLLIIALITSAYLYSQQDILNRCPYKGLPVTDSRIIKQADDFTITTTDGIIRNLYSTLDSGKTVFIDLFFTTCSWCQTYAPVIEEIYQNSGSGEGDIVFWGISNNLFDTNSVIDQYKVDYNVSNPCAGPDGGGTTAHTTVISGQNFLGWPTYCVVCPDRTMYFDPCYPPTVTGFDPYFEQCAETIGIDDNGQPSHKFGLISIYPNPVNTELTIDMNIRDPYPLTIDVFNLLGSKVLSSENEASTGRNTFSILAGQLPNGLYIIKLKQNGQVLQTQKILISR